MLVKIATRDGSDVDEKYPKIYDCSFISWNDGRHIISDLEVAEDFAELAQVVGNIECELLDTNEEIRMIVWIGDKYVH